MSHSHFSTTLKGERPRLTTIAGRKSTPTTPTRTGDSNTHTQRDLLPRCKHSKPPAQWPFQTTQLTRPLIADTRRTQKPSENDTRIIRKTRQHTKQQRTHQTRTTRMHARAHLQISGDRVLNSCCSFPPARKTQIQGTAYTTAV